MVRRAIMAPTLEGAMNEQIDQVVAKRGPGDLQALIYGGETWDVA